MSAPDVCKVGECPVTVQVTATGANDAQCSVFWGSTDLATSEISYQLPALYVPDPSLADLSVSITHSPGANGAASYARL